MPFALTRRDCLRLAGGGALGLALSPVPWKLLDDAAIWSQNMPWVPTPPRGEVTMRHALCTLCGAGCPVRARCVAGVPVGLAAAGGAHGAAGLCPVGVAAHHMRYHPARLRGPVRVERGGAGVTVTPVERAEVIAALAVAVARARRGGEGVVALDPRPGRTISWLYRQTLAAIPAGAVAVPPGAVTDRVPSALSGGTPLTAGVDLDRVSMLLSFGAPVLDGWSAPGRWERARPAAGTRPRLVQIETRPSRTALAADAWLAVRPGSEGAVALGLAALLIAEPAFATESLVAACGEDAAQRLVEVARRFTPQLVSALSGLPPAALLAAAADLARSGAAVALPGVDPGGGPLPAHDEAAVWALDAVLGAFSAGGALRRREELPAPAEAPLAPVVALADLPPRSVRVLVLDAAPLETALPWPLLERVLVEDGALVVSLSPFLTGLARRAEFVVPAPAPFETIDEALAPAGAARSTWAVAPALLAPPAGALQPAALLADLAAAAGLAAPLGGGGLEAALRRRGAALAARGGTVVGPEEGSARAVADLDAPDAVFDAVVRGGAWVDRDDATPWPAFDPLAGHHDELAGVASRPSSRGGAGRGEVTVMPYGWRSAAAGAALPPVLSKLYRESGLRPAAPQAAMSPATARACGVPRGGAASLATPRGTVAVEVVVDPAVMPGVVHLATGPDACSLGEAPESAVGSPADLLVEAGSPTWRAVGATLQEA